jgi:hypothetical protein
MWMRRKQRTSMFDDPWAELSIPNERTSISARRVSEALQWDVYWGRDCESRCLLLLRCGPDIASRHRLPRLKGIDVFLQDGEGDIKTSVVLRLLDSAQRDIFFRLCTDIIEAVSGARTEDEAIAIAVARTWRWHHLLRGGSSGLLTPEEQMGLMGELLVLERYFLARLPPMAAIAAWLGPLGAAKDFVSGQVAVEAKALGHAGRNEVSINSAEQLDATGLTTLFLHLSIFDVPKEAGDDGFTVTDVATRTRSLVQPAGSLIVERFDALLSAAGFRYEDDYSGTRWTGGERRVYEVRTDFPCLTPAGLPSAIRQLRYLLLLDSCAEFVVPPSAVLNALSGAVSGN